MSEAGKPVRDTLRAAREPLGEANTAKVAGRAVKIAHLDPYLHLHELADYSGLSVRTLRYKLNRYSLQ